MQLKISLIGLFFIGLIFCFLGFFAILVGKLAVTIYSIFLIALYGLLIFFKKDIVLKRISLLSKNISFKLLLLSFIWIILGILVSIFMGKASILGILNTFVGGLVFSLLIYLFMVIFLPKIINFKIIPKIILFTILGISLIGIFEFILGLFHNTILNSVVAILRNRNSLIGDSELYSFMGGGLPRIASVFDEPSHLAYFFILSSPIIFSLCFSKHLILKNANHDRLLKKITIFSTVICFILTQSAMNFFFAGIILIAFLLKKFFINPKKYLKRILFYAPWLIIFIIPFSPFLVGIVPNIVVLNRIITVLLNLGVESIIFIEPSLGTRIVTFVNYFIIFLKNPLFGVGYGNLTKEFNEQIVNSPLMLTDELAGRLTSDAPFGAPPSILFRSLAETGFLGFIFIYMFFISLILLINKVRILYEGLENDFITGLKWFLVILIATSIYDSNLNTTFIWIYIGIIQSIIISAKQISVKRD